MKKLVLFTISVCCVTILNAQWQQPSNVSSNSQNVYALASDGTNIFAGTGGAGISLSTNNLSSWTPVNNGVASTGIGALAISGTNVFAGGDGVYLSTNNGTSWTAVNNGLPTITNNSITTTTTINAFAISGTKIFAGTQNSGVYLSTNNGTLWTAANNGFDAQIQALAISGTKIFAGTGGYGVYVSSNDGGLWTSVKTGLTNMCVYSIAVSGTNLFAGTDGDGVFLSTNNGTNWTPVNNGLTNKRVYSVIANGTTIFAGTENGVFYSTNNGNNWTAFNTGFPANTAIWTLAISGTKILAGIRLEPYGVWIRSLSDVINGLNEIQTHNSFNLYPNPASDIVAFKTGNSDNGNMTLNIYNVAGTLVKTEMLEQNNRQINIADLNHGIYMVEIISKVWNGKQKLIIQ